ALDELQPREPFEIPPRRVGDDQHLHLRWIHVPSVAHRQAFQPRRELVHPAAGDGRVFEPDTNPSDLHTGGRPGTGTGSSSPATSLRRIPNKKRMASR